MIYRETLADSFTEFVSEVEPRLRVVSQFEYRHQIQTETLPSLPYRMSPLRKLNFEDLRSAFPSSMEV